MILFVFEGTRREPYIFSALKKLYWSEEETVITAYGCNIYALYGEMQSIGQGATRCSMTSKHILRIMPFTWISRLSLLGYRTGI